MGRSRRTQQRPAALSLLLLLLLSAAAPSVANLPPVVEDMASEMGSALTAVTGGNHGGERPGQQEQARFCSSAPRVAARVPCRVCVAFLLPRRCREGEGCLCTTVGGLF